MEKNNYKNKVKKNIHTQHLNNDYVWIIQVTLMAFILSIALSFLSDTIIPNVNILVSILILILFVFMGIIFDMIGVSVTVAEKKVFNSMAAKKIKGAKTAIELINNNSKVSSFCNDVVGDICGIISGAAGLTIATSLSNMFNINSIIICLIMTSVLAALTIGGKALGKSYAINKANNILYVFSKTIDFITFNGK